MHELAGTESDSHVRCTAADGLEEHKVSGLNLILPDLFAFVVLLPRLSREDSPVLGKHPLDEPAAIEPPRRLTATIQVGSASERQCRGDQLGGRGWGLSLRSGVGVIRDGRGNVGARKGLGSRHTATARTPGHEGGCQQQRDEPATSFRHAHVSLSS